MSKVSIIGAGGVIFSQNFMKDMMLDSELRKSKLVLMDISAERLENAHKILRKLSEKLNVPFDAECTTDLRTALKDTDYVITVFRCGTLEHQRIEYEIPAKYGVKHTVGDSLNPGGVFRGLRTLHELFKVVDVMEEVCPGAYLLNYVNPMSMNTIALSKRAKTVKVIGLCHSVQHTSEEIAKWVGVPKEEMSFYAAGVNHQAFMLKLEHKGRDLYPELRKCLDKPEIYNTEKVRFEILRHFGYFPTEGSGHGSEYVPYFRKRPDLLEKYCSVTVPENPKDENHWALAAAGVPAASLEVCKLMQIHNETNIRGWLDGSKELDLKHSNEYGIQIIAAIEKNQLLCANLNVMNHGLIPTLPPECSVEVPCIVNGAGIFPARIDNYPEQLANLNRGMINVQIIGAQGALNHSRRDIFFACAADPVTQAVCGLDEIQSMVDEMFEALRDQIDPEFFA